MRVKVAVPSCRGVNLVWLTFATTAVVQLRLGHFEARRSGEPAPQDTVMQNACTACGPAAPRSHIARFDSPGPLVRCSNHVAGRCVYRSVFELCPQRSVRIALVAGAAALPSGTAEQGGVCGALACAAMSAVGGGWRSEVILPSLLNVRLPAPGTATATFPSHFSHPPDHAGSYS